MMIGVKLPIVEGLVIPSIVMVIELVMAIVTEVTFTMLLVVLAIVQFIELLDMQVRLEFMVK